MEQEDTFVREDGLVFMLFLCYFHTFLLVKLMSDEIETFLIRFGIGLASIVGLAFLLYLLTRHFCAKENKIQRCTCDEYFYPHIQNDAMSIPETLPSQGPISSITSVSHGAEIDVAGSGSEAIMLLL